MIRSALLSVDKGQVEAAHALGMTYGQTLRRIIIPEALTVALPTIGNSLISAIKGNVTCFTCAVVEITAQGKIIGGRNYRYFEVYCSLAIIYWIVDCNYRADSLEIYREEAGNTRSGRELCR